MKLTKKKVEDIKADLIAGMKQSEAATKHGVSRSYVSDIATGRRHKDVGDQVPPKKRGGQHKPLAVHDPDNERIQELEAEVVHLREERDHARRAAKAGSKKFGIFKAMREELQAHITPFPPLPNVWVPSKKDTIEEHVVLHISDEHADEIIKPGEVGGLEEYNFPIFCARAEHLVDTVIDWTQSTLKPTFNFTTLWILCNGDATSGEIHGHVSRSYAQNQIKNCLAISRVRALMIRDLAPHFQHVNVVCTSGNHGRRSISKDYNAPHDNWDYLISASAQDHCRDIPNVSFAIPESWSVNLNINGVGVNLAHGDDDRSNGGIPWYSMVRRQKNLIALASMMGSFPIRYFFRGHHHTQSSLSDLNGEFIINGAWPGTNAFSFNAFAGFREPQQLLHGMNPHYGITWRLGVKLRHKNEQQGPKRYRIPGAEEIAVLK